MGGIERSEEGSLSILQDDPNELVQYHSFLIGAGCRCISQQSFNALDDAGATVERDFVHIKTLNV